MNKKKTTIRTALGRVNIWQVCSLLPILINACAPAFAADPSYTFKLRDNKEPEVCSAMGQVLNKNSRHMWKDPIIRTSLQDIYSNESIYAFPLLPGVTFDSTMTFQMRYSKIPTSPEFDAIGWREGQAVFGGGVGSATDINNSVRLPYLAASVDIDNDGIPDTVVKEGFSKGYEWMFAQGERGDDAGETLVVYRSQSLDWEPSTSLSEIIRGTSLSGRPLYIRGPFLRPFIYKKKLMLRATNKVMKTHLRRRHGQISNVILRRMSECACRLTRFPALPRPPRAGSLVRYVYST